MTIQISTGNYFRTAAHVGVRQKVSRRRPLDLPGGLQLWQAVGKVLLWSVPVILSLNLVCSSVTHSYRTDISATQQAMIEEEKQMEELLQQRTKLISPVRVKVAAAVKLDLFEPEPNQIKHM
jgi:ABC-type thiamine transport system ATPase subunit